MPNPSASFLNIWFRSRSEFASWYFAHVKWMAEQVETNLGGDDVKQWHY